MVKLLLSIVPRLSSQTTNSGADSLPSASVNLATLPTVVEYSFDTEVNLAVIIIVLAMPLGILPAGAELLATRTISDEGNSWDVQAPSGQVVVCKDTDLNKSIVLRGKENGVRYLGKASQPEVVASQVAAIPSRKIADEARMEGSEDEKAGRHVTTTTEWGTSSAIATKPNSR
jgi:hypothetical protein